MAGRHQALNDRQLESSHQFGVQLQASIRWKTSDWRFYYAQSTPLQFVTT